MNRIHIQAIHVNLYYSLYIRKNINRSTFFLNGNCKYLQDQSIPRRRRSLLTNYSLTSALPPPSICAASGNAPRDCTTVSKHSFVNLQAMLVLELFTFIIQKQSTCHSCRQRFHPLIGVHISNAEHLPCLKTAFPLLAPRTRSGVGALVKCSTFS